MKFLIARNANKNMRFIAYILFFIQANCFCSESIEFQLKNNIVDLGRSNYSSDKFWKVFMIKNQESDYFLLVSHGDFSKKITTSSKPDIRIIWSDDGKYMVVIKPVGFCTMADVYNLNRDKISINEIFSSEKYNQRDYVDYKISHWNLKDGNVVFNIVQNPRYLEGEKPRLFEVLYIFLDGENGFSSSSDR